MDHPVHLRVFTLSFEQRLFVIAKQVVKSVCVILSDSDLIGIIPCFPVGYREISV